MPEKGIKTLEDWKKFWSGKQIIDECDAPITEERMLSIITERSWEAPVPPNFHKDNQSQPGPNNLVRHRIDGRHCIGHGDGTWDYITGEFS